MSRIASAFERLEAEGRKALIPYFTAGDPDLASVLPIMQAMVSAGADVIELGVPFSDPMAEGPTIQRAMAAAQAYEVSISVQDVVVNGNQAHAIAGVTRRFRPRIGRPSDVTEVDRIELEKRGDAWMIVRFTRR